MPATRPPVPRMTRHFRAEHYDYWCHDCRDWTPTHREPWGEYACDRCGETIRCDECGQPHTDDHPCP